MENLEQKEMCVALFLDIQQAFDKVWHQGTLYSTTASYFNLTWNGKSEIQSGLYMNTFIVESKKKMPNGTIYIRNKNYVN